jgi:hypothetical protein
VRQSGMRPQELRSRDPAPKKTAVPVDRRELNRSVPDRRTF